MEEKVHVSTTVHDSVKCGQVSTSHEWPSLGTDTFVHHFIILIHIMLVLY
jgi:hypothetical protein